MWVEYCGQCKKVPVLIDPVARKTRCSLCGFESDHTPIQDGGNASLSGLPNPFLGKADLSIVNNEPKEATSDNFLYITSGNSQNRGSDSFSIPATDMDSSSSNDVIAYMSNRLGLHPTVKKRAYECFKGVDDFNNGNALSAGCIFIACRVFSDMTRSMEEITAVAKGATSLEISQAVEFLAGKLKLNINRLMDIKHVDFIKRFCFNLGMNNIEAEAVKIAAQSYESEGRTPVSVAAAFVCAFARHRYTNMLMKDIGRVSGVSIQTIEEALQDLTPYLSTEVSKMAFMTMEAGDT